MTEYINNTNKTLSEKLGRTYTMELPDEHRARIAQVCFDAFSGTRSRKEFKELIELLKPLCLWQSATPTLDEAYIDGIETALSLLKQVKP